MKRDEPASRILSGVDLHKVGPYGDTLGDGLVQVSFSLPVPSGPESREAARRLAVQMGLEEPQIYKEADLGYGFSFWIIYGKCRHNVDVTRIVVPKLEAVQLSFDEINDLVAAEAGRRLRIVGACTGTDAHTVGIDAILNMKGFAGEYGLERYPAFEVFNLGSQVSNDILLQKVRDLKADAVLVSQVVTQKDVHLGNLAELVDMIEAESLRKDVLLVCGGPRISHEVALELGFDAGFGAGTTPRLVADWIAREWVRRKVLPA
jgi:beta-lysine 5,6-aminomutase beta subunit